VLEAYTLSTTVLSYHVGTERRSANVLCYFQGMYFFVGPKYALKSIIKRRVT
jgi:hypothetical protein